MNGGSWPDIGPEELRELWRRHAPPFVSLENPDQLFEIREQFLTWLEMKGIDLGPGRASRPGRRRPRLERLALDTSGESESTEVVLSLGASSASGRRTGQPGPRGSLRMSAEATLDAVQTLIPQVSWGVEDAFTIEPKQPGDEIAVVIVRHPQNTGRYVGACRVSGSTAEAGAKAALDAINRKLELALAGSSPQTAAS